MCVALNGYHSVVTYEWNKDGYVLADEVYPLLYVTSVGKYVCSVTIVSKNKTVQQHFEVKSMCTFNLPTIESCNHLGTSRADISACESETTVDLNTGYLAIVFTNLLF